MAKSERGYCTPDLTCDATSFLVFSELFVGTKI